MYHDAALQFLTVQISTNDVLDSRNYQAFTIGSTVLPLTFALLNLGEREVPGVANWALSAALACYLLLLTCACRANFLRGLEYRPDIATLRGYLDDYDTKPMGGLALQEWTANEYLASVIENKRILVTKSRWIGGVTGTLFAEGLFLAVAAIVTVLL